MLIAKLILILIASVVIIVGGTAISMESKEGKTTPAWFYLGGAVVTGGVMAIIYAARGMYMLVQ